MFAIHIICRTDPGTGQLRNMARIPNSRICRSGNWPVSKDKAAALIGGWLYLHPSKSEPAVFSGRILGFEPIHEPARRPAERIVFLVEDRGEGLGQPWRGAAHKRARDGGLLPAALPHEIP